MTAATNLATEQTYKMTCTNCGANDWENVDRARLKPAGMCICKECANISYPEKWQSYEAIKAHYRKAYRNPPTANNFYTGQRKVHFHNAFLQSVFKEWSDRGLDAPVIFEVGAAYGMVLNWLRDKFPEATLGGTEWTTSYKRVAKHEYGLNLVDDFDTSKKHDLIISYKVAEHQLDVDKELRKYAENLTDNGYLYVSVPTWLDSATNFGMGGFDLEYYYDTNHINVWTREHFESILLRAGFEIVQIDYVMYDTTYLCKRKDENRLLPVYKANVDEAKEKLARIKNAYILFTQQKYDEAIKMWPDYPSAWISKAELQRKEIFQSGQLKQFIGQMVKACPNSADAIVTATDLLMRAEKFEDALKCAEAALKAKPENPASLGQLINIMRELALRARSQGDKEAESHYWKEGITIAKHLQNVSTQHYGEALNFIYQFAAQAD